MIYDKEVGLSTLDYSSSFVSATTALPTDYIHVGEGNYYVISSEPGYIFDHWTVPMVVGETSVDTIVYSDGAKGFRSYVLTSDTTADGSKTYYEYTSSKIFQQVSVSADLTIGPASDELPLGPS